MGIAYYFFGIFSMPLLADCLDKRNLLIRQSIYGRCPDIFYELSATLRLYDYALAVLELF
jgi:hypothetical protein